jgi:Xaa-Pro aminopeptidase
MPAMLPRLLTAQTPSGIPFDCKQLDALLEDRGLDALIVTAPHNIRYLLGGYSFFMYELADSIGLSRYLPALAYRRGSIEDALYVGAGNEAWGTDITDLWVQDVRNVSWSVEDTVRCLTQWCQSRLPDGAHIGVDMPYLPAAAVFSFGQLGVGLRDATETLETLRAVKRPHELEICRQAASAVVAAMLATFGGCAPGYSKTAISDLLRIEQTRRGLVFRYALIAAGAELNRAPSAQLLQPDDVLSLDSGATYDGWVADLTRMAICGEPTARHEELLAQVEHVQQAARAKVCAGTRGGDLMDAAHTALRECPDHPHMSFLAHGTGLVTHEAPRLTATGSPPYPAAHAQQPLQAGMVLSVETHVADPEIGFVKLEDTVIVTSDGPEAVGDRGRGWNRVGGS